MMILTNEIVGASERVVKVDVVVVEEEEKGQGWRVG